MKISQQIVQLRKKLKLSQRAFAAKINTSPWVVNNWEHDKNFPNVKTLRTIYKATGKKIDIYKGEEDERD